MHEVSVFSFGQGKRRLDVHIHLSRAWAHIGNASVRGSAFYGRELLNSKRLAQVFTDLRSPTEMATKLQDLNGFFSVVVQTPASIACAVDRVRSMPIFYAICGNQFYLSDNPRWILKEAKLWGWDRCSQVEFLLTGYVTGPHTLQNEIGQVQAGELIWVDLRTGIVHSERWYRYLPISEENGDMDVLLERLDRVARKAISRLITFAAGSPIVIPLSGGLDSRLIAMHLKLANYQPIYAFSYGRPGNTEAEISRKVAQQLGIEWKFVPYSLERWNAWYRSSEWQAYVRAADGLASVPHLQDWPAVWELLSRGDIPEHAVFVPGHTGDVLAGSHIPLELLQPHCAHVEGVVEAVRKHHYCLSSIEKVAQRVGIPIPMASDCVKKRIQSIIGDIKISSVEDAIGAYEYWEWQGRQAKFIVNSVRVYEFWKQAWWLPWWDAEFMDFWQRVPLRYRVRKWLWIRYVEQIQQKVDVSAPIPIPNPKCENRFKRFVRSLPYADHLLWIRRRRKLLQQYYHHFLAWYGITEPKRFIELLRNGGNINTILAVDHLELLKRGRGAMATREQSIVKGIEDA